MKRSLWLGFGMAVLLACAPAWAQEEEDLGFERPEPAKETPVDGFWPTDRMIENFLDHLAFNEMAEQYELDQDQMARTREVLQQRVPEFLQKNKAEIKTLINYFIETQSGFDAPETDAVTEWSRRVLPLANEFRDMVGGVADDMSTYLNDDQVGQLEAEMAGFDAGFTMATGKLKNWAHGGYDPDVDWSPPGPERKQRERMEERKMQAAIREAREAATGSQDPALADAGQMGGVQPVDGAVPGDEPRMAMGDGAPDGERRADRGARGRKAAQQPQQPADEWAQYTDKFVKDYELNAEQKQKAQTYLKAAQRARGTFLKKHDSKIEKLATRLDKPASKEDGEAARKEYDEVMSDMNKMFDQLKANLDKLPTRAQRKAYEEKHPTPSPTDRKKPAGTENAKSDEAERKMAERG